MTQTPANQPDPLVLSWSVQLIGTMVIAVVVYFFVQEAGAPLRDIGPEWPRYALVGGLLAIIPPLVYMQTFKRALDTYLQAQRKAGTPDPALRTAVASKLAIGGALSELPMAFGAAYLLMGGETRWFFAGVAVSLALRTSYRPFERRGDMLAKR